MGRFAKVHVFRNDNLQQCLNVDPNESAFTKTKVGITMGPSVNSVEMLCSLLEAGATCARVDLTWQLMGHHRKSLRMLQEAMRRTRRLCAVMLDCLGRDVLVRRPFGEDTAEGWPAGFKQLKVEAGQKVTITTDPNAECTAEVFPVTYPKFAAMVAPGDSITLGRYLATGAEQSSLYLEVVEVVDGRDVVCTARNPAVLDGLLTVYHQERSADGLSNLQNSMPALDAWDKEAIRTLTEEFEIDFVTLAYCRSAEDIQEARDFLASIGKEGIKIVAKCETRQALLNFPEICEEADAIIIARGNLGLDVAPEKMAMVQKGIITTCAAMGKPSIVARVVDTMAATPRPTRAEATDVANAVLDGVDAIMLGAETHRGLYPLETVKTVVAICREAELVFDHHNHFEHLLAEESGFKLEDHDETEEEDVDPEVPRSHRQAAGAVGSVRRNASSSSVATDASGLLGAPRTVGIPTRISAKLESIASGAVKAADKVGASLIIVVTHTGHTASMLAKYRPPMPIMTLVVPYLKNEGLRWTLEGRSVARQALLTSGLLPVLAAPTPSAGESLLEEAVALAASNGMVKPHDHVVVVSRSSSREAMIKIVSVSDDGSSIKRIRPTNLLEMIKAKSGHLVADELERASALTQAVGGVPATLCSLSRVSVIVGNKSDPLVPFDASETSPAASGRASDQGGFLP